MYSLENFELVKRRKVSCLADEVFVMGFSKENKMMLHRLIRQLKPKFQKSSEKPESVNGSENNEPRNLSNGDLFVTILSMKQTISEYNIRFTDLTKRVTYLEVELTKQRCIKCDDLTGERLKSLVDIVVCTENISDTYEQTLPEKADALIDSSQKMVVIAEGHCEINGIKQKSTRTYHDETVILDASASDAVDCVEIPFKHTTSQCKNILRKPKVAPQGKAATSRDNSETKGRPTFLVYVGMLNPMTNETSLRAHFDKIGIRNDDVADLFKLN